MLPLKGLYMALVTFGHLEALLPVSADEKARVDCLYANFAFSLH